MRYRLYLIAAAMAVLALVVWMARPDLAWVSSGLLLAAVLILLFATLGSAHGQGRLASMLGVLQRPEPDTQRAEFDAKPSAEVPGIDPRARMPRPAGPVGPAPVMQKRPNDKGAATANAGTTGLTPSNEN
jgi:hypothetical protein